MAHGLMPPRWQSRDSTIRALGQLDLSRSFEAVIMGDIGTMWEF